MGRAPLVSATFAFKATTTSADKGASRLATLTEGCAKQGSRGGSEARISVREGTEELEPGSLKLWPQFCHLLCVLGESLNFSEPQLSHL